MLPTPSFLIALAGAVPRWVESLVYRQLTPRQVTELALEADEVFGLPEGSKIMCPMPGTPSDAIFHAYTRGLAAMAFAPGGVRAFGLHFHGDLDRLAPDPDAPVYLRALPTLEVEAEVEASGMVSLGAKGMAPRRRRPPLRVVSPRRRASGEKPALR